MDENLLAAVVVLRFFEELDSIPPLLTTYVYLKKMEINNIVL